MSMIPIKPIENIQFGKALLASDLESVVEYLVYCYSDNSNLTTTGHLLYKYLTACKDVFASITHLSMPTTQGVGTSVVAFRNLARLARLDLKGDTLVRHIKNLSAELSILPNGTQLTSGANRAVTDLYIDVAKFVVGGNLKNFIGSWDNQKYADQDEVIGGMFIVLFYVTTLWNLHLSSMLDLLHSIGEFSKEAGMMRGSFKPLIPADQKTWGAVLVAQENAATAAVFGLSTAQLDDPALRAITVTKVSGYEALMNRLLTPSQWTWRFGRWMRVKPVFSMVSFEAASTGDGSVYTDFANLMGSNGLFSNAGSHKWRDFNNDLNALITDIKEFYFKNSAYGDLKAKFTLVPFGDMPVPAPSGNGGCVAYQMMDWVDGGVGSTSTLQHKFYKDTDDLGHKILRCRRTFNADARFLMLGDMDVEDYQLHHALIANGVDDQAGSVASIGVNKDPISIKGFFAFGVSKNEDEGYKIGRVIYDGVAAANTDTGLESKVPKPLTWTLWGETVHDALDVEGGFSLNYPISLRCDKTLFYYGRANDPFKKLVHQTVDVNELDIEKVLAIARKYFFPASASTIISTPIAVSAMPVKEDIPSLGKEQTKVSDDINSKVETNVNKPLAVSAAPASVALKDKVEDKK